MISMILMFIGLVFLTPAIFSMLIGLHPKFNVEEPHKTYTFYAGTALIFFAAAVTHYMGW